MLISADFPAEETKHCEEQLCPLCTTSSSSTELKLITVCLPKQLRNATANERSPVPPHSKATQRFGSSLMKWVSTIQSPSGVQMGNTRALSRVVWGDVFVFTPPETRLRGGRGGGTRGMGGLMNKHDLEVCDNSRSEMLPSTSLIPPFMITILWTRPRVCSLQLTPWVSFSLLCLT